jgi:hypothetical protein
VSAGPEAAWDAEEAVELARKALCYLERMYPSDAPLDHLQPYHALVVAVEATGDLEAYPRALRAWMRAGQRIARATRRGAA